ncbi:hypothetical protein BC829DRAFT_444663 [Chytridium lagenaria]|nr:hypothetical protein BC829DRAFT_444663 [Chytridium lagenaria]
MSKRMSSKYSTAISEPKTSLMAFQSHGDGRLAPELASNSDLRGQGKRVSAVRFSVHNSGSSELPMPDSASNREQTELTSSAFGSRTPLIHENTGLDAASTRRSRKSVIADTAQRAMAHAANTLMQEYSRNDYTMSSNLSTLYGITCSLLLYDAERSNLSVLICGGIFWAIEIFSELLLVIIETKNGVPIGPVRTFSGMLFIGLCFGNATYYVAAYAGVNNLYGYVE